MIPIYFKYYYIIKDPGTPHRFALFSCFSGNPTWTYSPGIDPMPTGYQRLSRKQFIHNYNIVCIAYKTD